MGLYLYGAGYFAREDQRLGILRGERTEASFCSSCPGRRRCEIEHEARVREKVPEAVDLFERQIKEGARRGATRAIVAVARMKSGDPDPFMALALENYKRGVQSREDAQESKL